MSGLVTLLTTKASGASSLLHGHRAKLATRLGCQGKLDSCPEWLLTLTPDQHITIFHCPHVSVAFDQTNCLSTRKQLIPTDTHQTAPLEHTWLKHGGEEGDWMASANSAKIQEADSIIIKEEYEGKEESWPSDVCSEPQWPQRCHGICRGISISSKTPPNPVPTPIDLFNRARLNLNLGS